MSPKMGKAGFAGPTSIKEPLFAQEFVPEAGVARVSPALRPGTWGGGGRGALNALPVKQAPSSRDPSQVCRREIEGGMDAKLGPCPARSTDPTTEATISSV